MSEFFGRLSIIGSQSSLDNDLLLRAGIPDAAQAVFAATQFLVKSRNFSSGQMIIVTGEKGSFGDAGIIVMTNARADPAQPFAVPLAAVSTESLSETVSSAAELSTSGGKKGSEKRAGRKSTKAAGEARSRSKASGHKGATKRRAAAKSSSKK